VVLIDDDDTSNVTLVRLLRSLTVEADRCAELFGDANGIHRTDLNALTVIMDSHRRGESMSPGRLAAALHLSPSATTAVLDRLEHSGYLERGRSGHDRRKIELRMPAKAMELGHRFFKPLDRQLSQAWEKFDVEQRRVVIEFLRASIDATVSVRHDLMPDQVTTSAEEPRSAA
jgi:DNA-binding MarR family transcriptional regulator